MSEPANPPPQPQPETKTLLTRVREKIRGPVLYGLIAALVAIGLSLYGMLTNPNAVPLTLRSFVLVVLIAGGSWGVVTWAIATAAVEAGKD